MTCVDEMNTSNGRHTRECYNFNISEMHRSNSSKVISCDGVIFAREVMVFCREENKHLTLLNLRSNLFLFVKILMSFIDFFFSITLFYQFFKLLYLLYLNDPMLNKKKLKILILYWKNNMYFVVYLDFSFLFTARKLLERFLQYFHSTKNQFSILTSNNVMCLLAPSIFTLL